MSARKFRAADDWPSSPRPVTVEARQVRLSLFPDAVRIRKNGIEFRSAKPFAPWTEMVMTMASGREDGKVRCTGVVVACTGNRHTGYHVSMLFTGMSRQAQARLNLLACATRP